MITYIKLKNFKSFSNIELDLRGKNKKPKNIAFIYGENGAGKSNLISSLIFLHKSMHTKYTKELPLSEFEKKIMKDFPLEDEEMRDTILYRLYRNKFPILDGLIREYKTINSKENMSLEIGFAIEGKTGFYLAEFDDARVVKEELRYQINERVGTFFLIEENHIFFSPSIFGDGEYKKELEQQVKQVWGKHTFLSILGYEVREKNKDYISKRLNEKLLDVLSCLERISIYNRSYKGGMSKIAIPFHFLSVLESGDVDEENSHDLQLAEKVLNSIFTQLYSDIKQVYYKYERKEDNFHYELVFKKMIDGTLTDIPFRFESTGTKRILDIIPYIFTTIDGNSVFMDEVDSGIHDLLMCEIINLLRETDFQGQFIATTHNTLLLETLPKENIYIISIDGKGNKEILSVDDYSFRTQGNHNIRKKYLEGSYEGVPNIGYIDLNEIYQYIVENDSEDNL